MSERHNCFQIQTPNGLPAKIHGDLNMQPATREALAELIDAAAKMRGSSPTVREGVAATLFDQTEPVEVPTAAQIKWAMNAWSRVCQHRISESRVRDYVEEHGWAKLEEELRYWLRMSRAPKAVRKFESL